MWRKDLPECMWGCVSTSNSVVYLWETFGTGYRITKWETGFQEGHAMHESLTILCGSRLVLFMPANLNESAYRWFCFFHPVSVPWRPTVWAAWWPGQSLSRTLNLPYILSRVPIPSWPLFLSRGCVISFLKWIPEMLFNSLSSILLVLRTYCRSQTMSFVQFINHSTGRQKV